MNTNKKTLYTVLFANLAVLLLASIIPHGIEGRIIAAIILVPAAVVHFLLIKKRNILSINKSQVLLIVAVIALLFLTLAYLSGLSLGFYKNPYVFGLSTLFNFILPISIVTVATEFIRHISVSQEDKLASGISYALCVMTEVLVFSTLPGITSFGKFMDAIGLTLFPALVANLVYHYLSKRYGVLPNIVYRLVTTLYIYIIPIIPMISDAIMAFVKIIIPILIFVFIDALFEKHRRYALQKKSKLAIPITIVAILLMLSSVMVISNQFSVGAYVIATPSMTGELNVGDVAIYEKYDDQTVSEGQVIVFEKNGLVVIHRVVDIEHINGAKRYYTKGDANEDNDSGFLLDGDIIGLVNLKIPFLGYPTLWLRSLFKR